MVNSRYFLYLELSKVMSSPVIQSLNLFICAFYGLATGCGNFVPRSFRPRTKSYFAPQLIKRTSLSNKFLGRSEATSHAWNKMTMERNDRIARLPQRSLRIISETIVLHHQVWALYRLTMCFQIF